MKKLNLKIFFFTFLIYVLRSNLVFAQSTEHFSFQKIGQENGLSDNNVQCIYKDKNGFMWIGTESGLNLLDGSDITIFKNIPGNPNSISYNFINDITADTSGLIWIGTQKGLNSLDPFLRKFTRVPLHKNTNTNNDNIVSLAVDKKNNLFIGTPSGLFYYDKKISKMSYIEMPGDDYKKILNNSITNLAVDNQGLLWLSTFNGLWSYNENSKIFTHEINDSNDPQFTRLFTCFIFDHSQKLWIGTWDKGLKEYDPVTKKITTYQPQLSKFLNVNCLAEVKQNNGKYLIYLNGNSLAFEPVQKQFLNLTKTSQFTNSMLANVLYTSDNNWLWMGKDDGLYYFNPLKNFIIHRLFRKPITAQGVSVLDWQNKILVSGEGNNFLKIYDQNLNEIHNYSNDETINISCLSLKRDGPIMIKAGTSAGIANINLLTGKIDFTKIPDSSKKLNTLNFITTLLKDRNHNWWLFPWRNGIWLSDSLNKNIHRIFKNFLIEYNIPKPLVIADATEDKNSNIWFGDYDEGIVFYNRKKNQFSKPFVKEMGEKSEAIQIIYSRDYCYSFSGSNLLKWNVDTPILQKIKLPSQVDKAISSITIDSTGLFWISTENGLVSYDQITKSFHLFTTADGLLRNEMDGTLYCLKNGKIVYASPGYLSEFDPEKMLKSIDYIPKIQLTEVIINGKISKFNTTHKMRFNHEVNNFIFKWAITDFNNPLNNHYYYQLQGIDNDWHYTGKKGEVEFASLSPGNYTLLLKGENSNGISASEILRLQFQIDQPFWKTWWFLTLLFLIILLFFYSLFRYRYKQLLKIEKLRNNISLDLHDDIGSTLSSISILSNIVLHQERNSKTKGMLHEIKENSISMMERMDDIVWSINPKNDLLENLFLRIKTFAAKLFEAKGINYKIEIDENIKHLPVMMEYRQHIYLIMKEAINNLVKYSDCTESQIFISHHYSILTVVIKDNGKGFDIQKNNYGNGLHNMKKRAKQMNAEIGIESKINEGTAITLKVKIKKG